MNVLLVMLKKDHQSKQYESKVEEIPLPDVAEEFIAPTGYGFMDTSTLDSVLSMVSCPRCFCTSLNLVEDRKQGLAFELK